MREIPIDPEVWYRADMLKSLGSRDVGAVYRILQRRGISQRRIAAITGQSQSEISEILGGRRVASYDVLVRIAEGFGVPRGLMGLAHDELATPAALDVPTRPVLDPESGKWLVRLPVFLDSYGAAIGLCESIAASPSRASRQAFNYRDRPARRWHRTADTVLAQRVGDVLPAAS